MAESLVRPLFEGPVDIVGDVHGEIGALNSLMSHLGYDGDGCHPDGRRLVFLGDLTDRGPDSPAVVDLVQQLVESERAQCVLGNHDLNILLGDRKHDNHWFYGEEWSLDGSDQITPAVLADETTRQRVTDFFKTLPVALEREDLRVIHACWDQAAIEIARRADDVVTLHHQHAAEIAAEHQQKPGMDPVERGLEIQNRNPVRMLTSGPECRAAEPFWSSGKQRWQERVHWWREYQSHAFCVFGHYSAYRSEPRSSAAAFCADYAVAKRWQERQAGQPNDFRGLLGAVRFPEKIVIFDSGAVDQIP
jgi:hypothetical protein